ncbi:peptidase inhibitor family I36 protein [Catenuloplanes sp. NPDC051500]|uniref:peptidase inhibitor family I36 protein n=1 Tax=Catenuloplanes sp. NPDC051500 TaxID=3363959 RepID=UPI0037A54258
MSKIRIRMLILGAATMLAVVFGGTSAASAAPAAQGLSVAQSAAVLAESAPAAAAAAAPPNCTPTNLCFWNYINYSDGPGRLSGSNPNWGAFSHASCPSGTWNDCASSLFNNGTSCTAHVYYYTNYGTPVHNIGIGGARTNLANYSTGLGNTWDNNIRSNNWC